MDRRRVERSRRITKYIPDRDYLDRDITRDFGAKRMAKCGVHPYSSESPRYAKFWSIPSNSTEAIGVSPTIITIQPYPDWTLGVYTPTGKGGKLGQVGVKWTYWNPKELTSANNEDKRSMTGAPSAGEDRGRGIA